MLRGSITTNRIQTPGLVINIINFNRQRHVADTHNNIEAQRQQQVTVLRSEISMAICGVLRHVLICDEKTTTLSCVNSALDGEIKRILIAAV